MAAFHPRIPPLSLGASYRDYYLARYWDLACVVLYKIAAMCYRFSVAGLLVTVALLKWSGRFPALFHIGVAFFSLIAPMFLYFFGMKRAGGNAFLSELIKRELLSEVPVYLTVSITFILTRPAGSYYIIICGWVSMAAAAVFALTALRRFDLRESRHLFCLLIIWAHFARWEGPVGNKGDWLGAGQLSMLKDNSSLGDVTQRIGGERIELARGSNKANREAVEIRVTLLLAALVLRDLPSD